MMMRASISVVGQNRARSPLVCNASLKKGDKMPGFQLKNQNGRNVNVKPGGKAKVIFFYPKDDSPGCTREAKAFNDAYGQLKKYADVYGISSDSPESHKNFCDSLNLSYTLLADEDGSVRKQFGVKSDLFGLLPGRETYVIAKNGTVLEVFNSQLSPEKHVEVASKALGV
jgi:thioredoxin-dependent peroxiredoxin